MYDADTWQKMLDTAEALGKEHGHDVATWVFDGNTKRETYEAAIKMINDGDPALDDWYRSPLSGEYADDMTPAKLMAELGADGVTPEQESELCEAYESAHVTAWEDEIGRAARAYLDE